jgi:threonine dehydrogenase-like Zn-dependent dehydrogenase
MKALYWDGHDLTRKISHPSPKSDSALALVRVRLAGICSTDLQIFKGYMDFHGVPGHEFMGEVIEGPPALIGKRVVGEINFGCGRCEFCRRGLSRHCPNRKVMGILGADGCFAEIVAAPAQNLHVVPDTVADEEAVFTEPLAAAFEILEQIEIDPSTRAPGMARGHSLGIPPHSRGVVLSERSESKDNGTGAPGLPRGLHFTREVLIFGDGKLGLLCAQVLALTGARVTLVGKHPDKLRLAKAAGVRAVLLADWKPKSADVVVEATGSTSGLEMALGAVRPRGTLVLKSTCAEEHRLSLAPVVINEITVIGSRCGLFPPALDALAEKKISVTPMIEKIYPLEDGVEAVAHAGRPGARKVLLRN